MVQCIASVARDNVSFFFFQSNVFYPEHHYTPVFKQVPNEFCTRLIESVMSYWTRVAQRWILWVIRLTCVQRAVSAKLK